MTDFTEQRIEGYAKGTCFAAGGVPAPDWHPATLVIRVPIGSCALLLVRRVPVLSGMASPPHPTPPGRQEPAMSASEQEMEAALERIAGVLAGAAFSVREAKRFAADLDLILALGALRERRRLGPWLRHDGMVPADILFGDRESCPGASDCACGLTTALEGATE